MYIDTHCYISSKDYDVELLINELKDNYVFASGDSLEDNKEVIDLIGKYRNVYGVIGYHPEFASVITAEDIILLEKQLQNKKIIAIGEIGLDYHYGKENIDKQKDLFIKQINLAKKYHLPIVIHSRDSINDTYNIVEELCKDMPVTMHCFSGSLEMAQKFTKLGVMLGIGGVVTFKNAKNLVGVVKNIDLKYLLLETDAPYLAPEPLRCTKNSSLNIPLIASKIAEIKGISLDTVYSETNKNAVRQFDLDSIL